MLPKLPNKDKSIQVIIKHLFVKYEEEKLKVKDYWDADECAIGVADPSEKYLCYISTFDLQKGRYHITLENLQKEDSELPYKTVGSFNNRGLNELEKIIERHLRIS